jgi:hypothetical protein
VNGTVLRRVATVVVSAGLVLGLGPTAAGAATAGSSATKAPSAPSAVCTQLKKRLAAAQATLRRVDANLQELRALLAEVRLPARRAVLEARIQRLEQLRTELAARMADARTACSNAGTTT